MEGRPIALGNALTAAEAGDGNLTFTVKRAGRDESVTIAIPVLGTYSRTWPLNCRKSDAIVRQAAEFVMRPENLKNPGFFGGLFLLSTGDDNYLPAVKELVERHSPDKAGDHTWNNAPGSTGHPTQKTKLLSRRRSTAAMPSYPACRPLMNVESVATP